MHVLLFYLKYFSPRICLSHWCFMGTSSYTVVVSLEVSNFSRVFCVTEVFSQNVESEGANRILLIIGDAADWRYLVFSYGNHSWVPVGDSARARGWRQGGKQMPL